MVCLIALIVFSVLGIFSLSYRRLAKEAFDCVFRRITLRPCNTGFDQKIKAKIVGKLLSRNFRIAKFTHRYFEVISWVFVIIFFISMVFSAKSIYNLVRYRSCNPQNPQSCVLTTEQQEVCQCEGEEITCKELEMDRCKEEECENCEVCNQ